MERERVAKQDIVIWALYDDAECSYKKGIKKYLKNFQSVNIEVHSIGINDIQFNNKKSSKIGGNFFYHKIDLSLNNCNLINELKKISKKPDVILASPPCESWSGADCDAKIIRKINSDCKWIVRNYKWYEQYNKKCHPVKRRNFIQKERGRLIGESTIGGTIEIIKKFKPKVWVIENPKTSKTWEFQKNHWNFEKGYFMNDTHYSSYDPNFSLKPTIFKSNIKLNLKKDKNNPSNKNHIAYGNYSKRSAIPLLLVKDLIEQILCSNEMNLPSFQKYK